MKKAFFVLVMSLFAFSGYCQDNLKVVKYILLTAESNQIRNLGTYKVPEGVVWKIESVACEKGVPHATLVLEDKAYVIGMEDQAYNYLSCQLPFYLPSNTEFKLGVEECKCSCFNMRNKN